LEACDFIVVQDIFPTETSVYADVLLPGASFAEKSGTYTNTERRVQLIRKAIEPLFEAREDWRIISDLARRILAKGERKVEGGTHTGWEYESAAEVMAETAALTPSYAGISHERLERGERLQWPVSGPKQPGTPILHVGRFAGGVGKFAGIEHQPPVELPDEEYPILLTTGRVLYHWHGGEMTRRASGLVEIYDQPLVELNPEDAQKLGVAPSPEDTGSLPGAGADTIRITSRRGSIEAMAWVTDRVPPGVIHANFHFPDASANILTIDALDPVAKIPEYKVCAVRVEKV
jgi:formate dehydrogenase major subunit/formate dehydrogenase alpha subunit